MSDVRCQKSGVRNQDTDIRVWNPDS